MLFEGNKKYFYQKATDKLESQNCGTNFTYQKQQAVVK